MSLIKEIFGSTPFGPLVRHSKKVQECMEQVRPLMQALIDEDFDRVHALQDTVSSLEHEADQIKNAIRDHLPRRYFLPVEREDLNRYLHCQDSVADAVEDFAVILVIRKTKIHPKLAGEFLEFVEQVVKVGDTLVAAAEELETLAETSFAGAEAEAVLEKLKNIGEDEWKADRMQRRLSSDLYDLEQELDPITILFYEKMLQALSEIANAAENTGELLRTMIVKG
jgi:hypothetical protein